MKQIHHDTDATYGKRRMLIELKSKGFDLGIYKVFSRMKQLNSI